ncbi:glutamate 5-kinase [Bremerella cremea]|uniref:glutamate 5-kinase n=1 Tax=Bremerella cremea TaxID=1031537 RepID=UPI0031F0E8EA
MTDLLRQEITTSAHTIVVKVGTRVLTTDQGVLNEEQITQLGRQLAELAATGRRVVLVSSGAVGAGMSQLGLTKRPTDLARLQAVAAVGQAKLIEIYDRALRDNGRHAAQVLLTAEDLDDRTRYLNIRNTLLSVLDFGAIPIINENDTVAVEELMLTFGDNDRLAARVTNLIRAPLLILLSDVQGLYNGSPELPESKLLSVVPKLDEEVLSFARDKKTGHSKGGMASKLEAARMVTSTGENMIIASGRIPDVLTKLIAGEEIGTLFLAQGKAVTPRKRWIGYSVQPRGDLMVDDGAARALGEKGKSLLPIGVTEVRGSFGKGDVVRVCNAQGQEIARGLTNYTSEEVGQILGSRSDQIEGILGVHPYDEIIHRDNMTVSRV